MIGEQMRRPAVEIVETEHRKRPWEIWHLQSDNSKLYSVIDARPQVPLEEALARTIAYYQANNFRWDW